MSSRIDAGCYSQLIKQGFRAAEKEVASFSELIVKLFGVQYLTWVLKEIKLSNSLKKAVLEQHFCNEDIQRCYQEKKENLEGKFVGKWAASIRPTTSIENFDQRIEKQKKVSYSILPFPSQVVFMRGPTKNQATIDYYEEIQIRGTELLFDFFSGKKIQFDDDSRFCMQRTLFTHQAFIEVSWVSLILEWAQEERLQQVKELFKLFGNSLPKFESLPKQGAAHVQPEKNLRKFVIERTLKLLESTYGLTFTPTCRILLSEAFLDERVRLDVLYFAIFQKDKLESLHELGRKSQLYIRSFSRFIQTKQTDEIKEDLPNFFENILKASLGLEGFIAKSLEVPLVFPFHASFIRENKSVKVAVDCEAFQIKGIKLLFDFLRGKKINLDEKSILSLEYLLFTQYGLIEKGRFVSWISLILEWAHAEKIPLVQELFNLFQLKYENLPKPSSPIKKEDFREFLAEKTIRSLEETYGFSFTPYVRETLRESFGDDKVRSDLFYFAGFKKDQLSKITLTNHGNPIILNYFRRFLEMKPFFDLKEEELPLFLETIFRTDFNFDLRYEKYYPKALIREIHPILSWLYTHKKEENSFFLLCFLAHDPKIFDQIKDLSFPDFSSLQIIRFLLRNGQRHLELMSQFTEFKESESICDFTKEHELYLFALSEEKEFQNRLELLRRVSVLLNEKLEAQIAFSFLISKVDLTSVEDRIFKLLEALPQLETDEEVKLQILEIQNCLTEICQETYEVLFPSFFSDSLMKKFWKGKPHEDID